MKKIFFLFLACLFVLNLTAQRPELPADSIRISIIFDNYSCDSKLETAWGFACLIEGLDKTVLFDTGNKGELLLNNMAKMGIDPKMVDLIILSHNHWDHFGGLKDIASLNPEADIYLPDYCLEELKEKFDLEGYKLNAISTKAKIIESLYTSGVVPGPVDELLIGIKTSGGIIAITGCAHPGPDVMIQALKSIMGEYPKYLMGGFHTMRSSRSHIQKLIENLKNQGVEYAWPTHCSGDRAINMFAEEYQDKYTRIGAGKVLYFKK